jgi:hypothetical protein
MQENALFRLGCQGKPWRIRGFVDGRVRSHLVERFWGPSELTIREWIGSINTSAFHRTIMLSSVNIGR